MLLTIPHNGKHRQVRVTIRSADWSTDTTLDDSHKTVEVKLPAGVEEDSVEAFAEYIDNRGEIDPSAGKAVMKTKKRINRGRPVR